VLAGRRASGAEEVRDMLADFAPIPTVAVTDLPRAQEFYEGVLGFSQDRDAPDGVMYRAGSGSFLVYPSSFAGSNKATYMSFQVPGDAFDDLVAGLRSKSVEFLTFETPVGTWSDGVADFGDGARAVWFTDPDGNILNIDTVGS
jgi:catechol 2,3-dioxygenase-like lactoylglutathione lyase family enzyme